jgi:hypothetical protein
MLGPRAVHSASEITRKLNARIIPAPERERFDASAFEHAAIDLHM